MNISDKFCGLEDSFSDFEKSKVVVASAPFEGTVSYGKGAARAPAAIIKASQDLEFYIHEINANPVEKFGIATLEPYNLPEQPELVVDFIEQETKKLLELDKFVVTLGGEHSISIGPARAYSEKFKDLSILYLDAHADLRDEFDGSNYNHACTLRRISEFNENFVHVGCRSLCEEEIELIEKEKYDFHFAKNLLDTDKIVENLHEDVYISFDMDVFDTSLMPATGTPEPGGLMWPEVLNLIRLVGQKKNIVGFDLTELAPINGFPAYDFTAAKLAYKTIGYALLKL